MTWKHERYAKILSTRYNLKLLDASVLKAIAFACYEQNTDSGLADHATLSNPALATRASCGVQSVPRATASLEKRGLLTRLLAHGKAPTYHFPLPDDYDPFATDDEIDATIAGRNTLTPEERRHAAMLSAMRAAGSASPEEYENAVFSSPEDRQHHTELFRPYFYPDGSRVPGRNPADVLRASLANLTRDLPYDPSVREDGLQTPYNRFELDQEQTQ